MATSGKRSSTSVKQKSSTSSAVKSLAGSVLAQTRAPAREKPKMEPKKPWRKKGEDRESKDILSKRKVELILGGNEKAGSRLEAGFVELNFGKYEKIFRKTPAFTVIKEPAVEIIPMSPLASKPRDWQSLLEEGLRYKVNALNSPPFRSTTEIAKLLGVGDAAIRRRLREQKIFSIKSPTDCDYRIPAWAVDPEISGATTKAILGKFGTLGDWTLYEFFSRPNGAMKGLCPFELLISPEHLSAGKRATLYDLWSGLEGHFSSPAEYVINVLTAQAEEDLGYVIANSVPSEPA